MDTPRSALSVSSTNLEQADADDESPLIEEFLNGIQYYEANEHVDKSDLDADQQNVSLVEFFARSAPKGICPFALADMCNRSLFDFTVQELLQCLEEALGAIRYTYQASEEYLMVSISCFTNAVVLWIVMILFVGQSTFMLYNSFSWPKSKQPFTKIYKIVCIYI